MIYLKNMLEQVKKKISLSDKEKLNLKLMKAKNVDETLEILYEIFPKETIYNIVRFEFSKYDEWLYITINKLINKYGNYDYKLKTRYGYIEGNNLILTLIQNIYSDSFGKVIIRKKEK